MEPSVEEATRAARRRFTVRHAELATAALLALWSLLLLVALLVDLRPGEAFTGADSREPPDQLQYLAWVRDAGEHFLASNLFDLRPSHHVFVHPMWTLSGGLWQLGLSPQVTLLIWKPVAVVVLFVGVARYVRERVEPDGWGRPAALFLALFYFTPALPLIYATGIGGDRVHDEIGLLGQDLFTAGLLWGYPHAVIAVGMVPLFLLAVERLVEPGRRAPGRGAGWYAGWAAAAGLTASWLHPWQGLIALLTVAGFAVWGGIGRNYRVLAAPLVATALPLAYYYALSRFDPSWELARAHTELPRYLIAVVIAGLAPIGVGALAGVRGASRSPGGRMLLVWPVAALLVYFVAPTFPFHAFNGISIPLAVLAVRGWRHLREARALTARGGMAAGLVCIGVLTLSTAVFAVRSVDKARDASAGASAFIAADDLAALDYLSRLPARGGVLTSYAPGYAVPGFTGRATWVGHRTWTPRWRQRWAAAYTLVTGGLPPPRARALVRRSGATFVLAPCAGTADLRSTLAPLGFRLKRFGCARLYMRESTASSRSGAGSG